MQLSDEEKRELAEIYERAAEYLEEYGWLQGDVGAIGGPRCFYGAICSIADGKLEYLATNWAAEVLELERPENPPMLPIAFWNDQPDRTADEVINTLHALANKLR